VLARWAPLVLLTGAAAESPQDPGPQAGPARPPGRSGASRPAGPRPRLIEGHLATRTWPCLLEPPDAACNDELAATLTRCPASAAAALAGDVAS
jgi:hypothetical protein